MSYHFVAGTSSARAVIGELLDRLRGFEAEGMGGYLIRTAEESRIDHEAQAIVLAMADYDRYYQAWTALTGKQDMPLVRKLTVIGARQALERGLPGGGGSKLWLILPIGIALWLLSKKGRK